MNRLYIGLVFLLGTGIAIASDVENSIGDIQADFGGGSVSGNVCWPDDINASFGGTCVAPYYWIEYTSGSTAWTLNSTDCDGIGTNCAIATIADGGDSVVWLGSHSIADSEVITFGASDDYWIVYNDSGTQWELWTSDADGIGGDLLLLSWDDGTSTMDVTTGATFGAAIDIGDFNITSVGDVELDSLTAAATSGGITMGGTGATSAESLLWQYGETGNQVDVTSATGATDVDWGALSHTMTNADIEGTTSIGGGSALSAADTLICDRDFSTATNGRQLNVGGIVTVTGGTSSVAVVDIAPDGVVLNDGGPGAHAVISSLQVSEPVITETVGTCTAGATVHIVDAPTECGTNNYALWVDAGAVQIDGSATIGVNATVGGIVYIEDTDAWYEQSNDRSQIVGKLGVVLLKNNDDSSGNAAFVLTGSHDAADEMTASAAVTQYGVWHKPRVNQTGSAVFEGFALDVTDAGSPNPSVLMRLDWGADGVYEFEVQDDGDTNIGGKLSHTADTVTIADSGDGNPATDTLEPTSSNVQLTCNDVHKCTMSMGDTNAVDGDIVRIVNVSANVCDFADTGGVTELVGAYAMGQWQSLDLLYTVDRWRETSRSAN